MSSQYSNVAMADLITESSSGVLEDVEDVIVFLFIGDGVISFTDESQELLEFIRGIGFSEIKVVLSD